MSPNVSDPAQVHIKDEIYAGIIIDVVNKDARICSLIYYDHKTHQWVEIIDVPENVSNYPDSPYWKE